MGVSSYDGDSTSVKGDDGSDDGVKITASHEGTRKRLDVSTTISQESSNSGIDAFSRLRVSNSETIFDSAFRWDKHPIRWTEQVTSGGAVTHNANIVSVELSCTSTTGSSATFQSRQYIAYHPGKSQLIMMTGNFKGGATGVTKRLGYFDGDNGVFFQLSGSTLSVVRRSKTSGSVVDTGVNQADWNIDKLDGTGVSGIAIDTTKQQIFVIDFQWLGSGRIRYGMSVDGKVFYCHEISTANILTVPWSQTGDAPIRAQITNAGSTASDMHITCAAVICENLWAPDGNLRTVNNGNTSRSIAGFGTVPILSLRKQSAYVNVPVRMMDFLAFGDSLDNYLIQVVYNGTLTGASWVNVDGVCQRDVSATAISGGTYVYSRYTRGNSGGDALANIFQMAHNTILGRDLAGNSDVLSIVVTNVTSGSTILGAINYKELL